MKKEREKRESAAQPVDTRLVGKPPAEGAQLSMCVPNRSRFREMKAEERDGKKEDKKKTDKRKKKRRRKRRRRKTMSSSDACDSAFSQRQFGKKQILCLESNDLGK